MWRPLPGQLNYSLRGCCLGDCHPELPYSCTNSKKSNPLAVFIAPFGNSHFFHQFFALWECCLDACLGRAPSGSLGRQIQFGFQLQKCQPSRKNGLRFPAWHFCLAGGAGLGGIRDQGSFLDIARIDNPLAKNDGLEEQANQDGVLARTWTSQNVRMYRTKHPLLKTCWNYVFSVAGFRAALKEIFPWAA